MKYLITGLALIVMIMIQATPACAQNKEPPDVKSCIYYDGRNNIDLSKFVSSGEFYVDGEIGIAVRKKPLPFPADDLRQAKRVRKIAGFSWKKYDAFLDEYLKRPDWYEGLKYLFTRISIIEGEPTIGGEVFQEVVKNGDQEILIRVNYDYMQFCQTHDNQFYIYAAL
ncbi:MAG: hypothetical protein LBV21_01850 [Candidatus Adiutrix sp.]|jgi:hypothetical protein|nr:hypothetical protein [Candidatus Adiutrix sp.]